MVSAFTPGLNCSRKQFTVDLRYEECHKPTFSGWLSHVQEQHASDKRIVYKLAVMVYKCLHGLAPPYLAADCVPVTSVASRRHLRSAASGCLAVTGTRTTLGRRNFAVTGATIWNNLPADLRLHSQSLLSLDKNWNSICLSHERIWGILFKSRYTNVRIIIILFFDCCCGFMNK